MAVTVRTPPPFAPGVAGPLRLGHQVAGPLAVAGVEGLLGGDGLVDMGAVLVCQSRVGRLAVQLGLWGAGGEARRNRHKQDSLGVGSAQEVEQVDLEPDTC